VGECPGGRGARRSGGPSTGEVTPIDGLGVKSARGGRGDRTGSRCGLAARRSVPAEAHPHRARSAAQRAPPEPPMPCASCPGNGACRTEPRTRDGLPDRVQPTHRWQDSSWLLGRTAGGGPRGAPPFRIRAGERPPPGCGPARACYTGAHVPPKSCPAMTRISAAPGDRSVHIRARSGVVRPRGVSTRVGRSAMTSRRATIAAADGLRLVSPTGDPWRAWGAVDSDGAFCRPDTIGTQSRLRARPPFHPQ